MWVEDDTGSWQWNNELGRWVWEDHHPSSGRGHVALGGLILVAALALFTWILL